ncbi:MAG TPA: metal-dependent hydrolase [Polyangiaceae bacterium]|nr:metal-dependent hydrolase [Polyangiaceae bacterium]
MENLTHSLVGLLCAEVVVRVVERRRPLDSWARGALYAIAIVGNNLPDLDFTYSRISGPRFGYLLQHRGYTHTVPAAFGFALATLAVLFGISKWRNKLPSARDWWLCAALALVSPLLHIAMDFSNNYGVHPFWPLYDGWFYGDSVFILEPSFWLVLIAPLVFSYRSRLVRGLLLSILALALAAVWYRPFVPRGNAAVLTLVTVCLLAFAHSKTPFSRMLLASAGFALVLGSFVLGSRMAKVLVRERALLAFPGARTLDIVATPMPANPLCWSVLLVQRDERQYFVRLGRAAVAPSWLTVGSCPFDRAAQPTAPLRAISAAPDSRLILSQEYRVSLADLRAVASERCAARALLRFARVPYLSDLEADGSRVIGDLRYDRNPSLDFSDVRLGRKRAEQPDSCPKYVPPWRPPRGDILSNP